MQLLLDSHTYVWWLTASPRLSQHARQSIADPDVSVFVSAASIWELSIKASLGRIDLGGSDLVAEIGANGFLELGITAGDADRAGNLPRHHDDPFDRMLIAQALEGRLACVTRDAVFEAYGVPTLW